MAEKRARVNETELSIDTPGAGDVWGMPAVDNDPELACLDEVAFATLDQQVPILGQAGGEGTGLDDLFFPVERPGAGYFRVHPSGEYDRVIPVVFSVTDRDKKFPHILVHGAHRFLTPARVSIRRFILAYRQTGECYLWDPGWYDFGANPNDYHRSVARAIDSARDQWVRLEWSSGVYRRFVWDVTRQGEPPTAVWPEADFREILAASFEGRVIATPDHPILHESGRDVEGGTNL